jgi:hypothetical protein
MRVFDHTAPTQRPSARICALTSEDERDGNDKQDADGNRQNLDGVIVWSVTV